MRKEGQALILEPAAPKSLAALLATLSPITDEFAPIAELATSEIDV